MCNSNLNNVKHIRQIKSTRAFSPIARNFLAQKLMTSSHVFSSDLETIFTPTSLILVLHSYWNLDPPYSFPFSRHAKMRREEKSLWNEELSYFSPSALSKAVSTLSQFLRVRERAFSSRPRLFFSLRNQELLEKKRSSPA